MADEMSSYTNSTFAAPGGISPIGKSWVGKDSNAVPGIALDIGKTANPLYLWAMEISYTIPELQSAMAMGRPVDSQKHDGMQLKYQMDVDEMVYTGDTFLGKYGMLNSPLVTPTNVANGALGSPLWVLKSPDEILVDVNALLMAAYKGSGWARAHQARHFSHGVRISIVSETIPRGRRDHSQLHQEKGHVHGEEWQAPRRRAHQMVHRRGRWRHARNGERLRQDDRLYPGPEADPHTPRPHAAHAADTRSLYHITTYFCKIGCVELVYPETVAYADGYM